MKSMYNAIGRTSGRIGLLLLATTLPLSTGCFETDAANELLDELLDAVRDERAAAEQDERGVPAVGNRGDRGGGVPVIADGSSNTIFVGEDTARRGERPETSAPAPSGDGSVREVDPDGGDGVVSPERPADPPVDPPTDNLVGQLTAQLSDRFFEFGTSSFFDSGSITENTELQTCGFGRFGMRVTRITSSTVGDLSSESTLIGTWSVALNGADPVLVLNVESASDPADVGTRQIAVAVDPNTGEIFFDGNRASVTDASADCAAAQG